MKSLSLLVSFSFLGILTFSLNSQAIQNESFPQELITQKAHTNLMKKIVGMCAEEGLCNNPDYEINFKNLSCSLYADSLSMKYAFCSLSLEGRAKENPYYFPYRICMIHPKPTYEIKILNESIRLAEKNATDLFFAGESEKIIRDCIRTLFHY